MQVSQEILDEARIARLTELAQRVWPKAEVQWHDGMVDVGQINEDGGYFLLVRIWHPRALDALEAALLVLSGTRFMVMIPPTRGYIEWQNDAQDEPPAWAEQLASGWEREADRLAEFDPAQATTLSRVATELRERAREG